MNFNAMMELTQYPDLATTLFMLQKFEHKDPAKQAALEEAGKTLDAAIDKNPSLISDIGEQIKANPKLKAELKDMAQNDPEALNAKMPEMIANPRNLAAILNDAGTNPATQQKQTVVAKPEPVSGTVQKERSSAIDITASKPSTNVEESPSGLPKGANKNNFNTQSGAAAEQKPSEPVQQVSQEDQVKQQIQDTMKPLMAASGGMEFFKRINENPELKEAMGNAMGGENTGPNQALHILNKLKERVDSDPEFFNKANAFMDEHPGMVKNFAETFANNPDKAFERMDQAMMLDNTMGKTEGLLTKFLGPGAFGEIMGFLEGFMEMFMPLLDMFDGLEQTFSAPEQGGQKTDMQVQSNSNGELTKSLQVQIGNDGRPAFFDKGGNEFRQVVPDNAHDKSDTELENNRQGTSPAVTSPGLGN